MWGLSGLPTTGKDQFAKRYAVRVYRRAAIFREADYSGQILNAERKCLPTVSCSETNMCDPAVSKAVVGNSTAGSVAYEKS